MYRQIALRDMRIFDKKTCSSLRLSKYRSFVYGVLRARRLNTDPYSDGGRRRAAFLLYCPHETLKADSVNLLKLAPTQTTALHRLYERNDT